MGGKKEILLVGGGGHCRSCIEVIESSEDFQVGGIIDRKDLIGQNIMGHPVIGSDEDLQELRSKFEYACVTVGQIKSAALRIKLFRLLLEYGYQLPVIQASTAYVSERTKIGQGTIIMQYSDLKSIS